MIHERDVRTKIAAAVSRAIPLEDFADWVISNSWNMLEDSTPETIDLVSSIELLLAERDNYALTDAEVLSHLQPLLDTIVLSKPSALPSRLVKSSANAAFLPPIALALSA